LSLTIAAMPAHNEEDSIAKVVLACKKHVDRVIVVDDGSTDSTAEIATALGAYVIRHETNKGYGAALRTCFETAKWLSADRMVIMDSDGQHDPNDIPKLLASLDDGADIVIGSRFCGDNGHDVPAYRRIGMKILDTATNMAGGVVVSDSQSGYRAYRRKAIDAIRINENGMPAGSEILIQSKSNNLKVKEIEIDCRYDLKGTSTSNPFSHGADVLLSLLHEIEQKKPLLYFSLPGIILTTLGLIEGVYFIFNYFQGEGLKFGPTLLMILLCTVGSYLTLTGIILHTLSEYMNISRK
jgi:glycosyltransferase involved in cell wall biosynthesis